MSDEQREEGDHGMRPGRFLPMLVKVAPFSVVGQSGVVLR